MGCLNPASSDIDLLIVSRRNLAQATKIEVAESAVRWSLKPRPLELTVVSQPQLRRWCYPTPFEFHYSEDWRDRFIANAIQAIGQQQNAKDSDLAIQIATVVARGGRLHGESIRRVFEPIPRRDCVASMLQDFAWARKRVQRIPVYFVLNACRVYGYLIDRKILSKDEAGVWALRTLPIAHREIVRRALHAYRRGRQPSSIDPLTLRQFAAHMNRQIRRLASVD